MLPAMKWDSNPVGVNEYGCRSGRSTERLPFVELTDTVQWSTPFQEFLFWAMASIPWLLALIPSILY